MCPSMLVGIGMPVCKGVKGFKLFDFIVGGNSYVGVVNILFKGNIKINTTFCCTLKGI